MEKKIKLKRTSKTLKGFLDFCDFSSFFNDPFLRQDDTLCCETSKMDFK